MQLPLISFERDKNIGSFWSTVHSKQMINPELSNAIAHDEKIVLSFTKLRKCRDRSDPLRSVIILQLDLIAKKLHNESENDTGRRLGDRFRERLRHF